MIASIKRNFGSAAFVFPLSAVMGFLFNVPVAEILYSAAVMYISVLVLMILDDTWVIKDSNPILLSEEELLEMDKLVNSKSSELRITVIK